MMPTHTLNPNNPLISAKQLFSLHQQKSVVILDASKLKAVSGAPELSATGHIPGSQLFDYAKAFVDNSSPLGNTMPSEAQFTRSAQALGINKDSTVVIYDARGVYSSPRAWWMFKTMGHQEVYVLDGGLKAWVDESYAVSESLSKNESLGNFNANYNANFVYSANNVIDSLSDSSKSIIDARSANRFHALVPEPREGLRSGHIPSSLNIPFKELISDGKFLTDEEISNRFKEAKFNPQQKLIASCGSGLTACIILLAAYKIGYHNLAVYDGSWNEWGADSKFPIE